MAALPPYFEISEELAAQLERTSSRSVLRLAPTDPKLYQIRTVEEEAGP